MVGASVLVEAFLAWLLQNPDTGVLTVIGVGLYYELHHGRIAAMVENQYILGTAVYELLRRRDDMDEEGFREDLWDEADERVYPGDWDEPPPEPPDKP